MSRRRLLTALPHVGLLALEWLCVTLAFASVVVHSANALRDFVSPSFGGAAIFIGAFLLAGLLGLAVESARALVPMTVGMCLVGASIYGGVVYSPVWLDISVGTVTLQNYVTQQALLIFLWSFIPALAGAIAGNFAGAGLRERARAADGGASSWWDRPAAPTVSSTAGAPEETGNHQQPV